MWIRISHLREEVKKKFHKRKKYWERTCDNNNFLKPVGTFPTWDNAVQSDLHVHSSASTTALLRP